MTFVSNENRSKVLMNTRTHATEFELQVPNQLLLSLCVASVHLYYLFPSLEEGGLATYRTAIVQNQHLAMLAKVHAPLPVGRQSLGGLQVEAPKGPRADG